MDFSRIMAGEPIRVGERVGCRLWRYRLVPLQLLSWRGEFEWSDEPFQGAPDDGDQCGIHANKTMSDLREYIGGSPGTTPTCLWIYEGGCDGVVIGSVALWGVVIIHQHGYRAQYARPLAFLEAYGKQADRALLRLRSRFGVEA